MSNLKLFETSAAAEAAAPAYTASKPRKPRAPKLTENEQKLLAAAQDPLLMERLLRVCAPKVEVTVVTRPMDAFDIFHPHMMGHADERLMVLALDRRRRFIGLTTLTVGSDAFTIVDPKQVLRWALRLDKTPHGIIVAHNHPSGDPEPSSQDADVTDRLARAGRVIGIPLLDHLVITDHGFVSLAERGLLPLVSNDAYVSWTQ